MKTSSMTILVIAIVVAIIIAVIVFYQKYETEQSREDNRDKLFWWIAIGVAIALGLYFLGVFSMWSSTGDEEYGIRAAIKQRYRDAVDRRRAANDASEELRKKQKNARARSRLAKEDAKPSSE